MQVKQNNECNHIFVLPINTKDVICIKCRKKYNYHKNYQLFDFTPNIDLNLTLEEYQELYYKALSFNNKANSKQIIMLMHAINESNKINNKFERTRK